MTADRIVVSRQPVGGLARRDIYEPRDDGRWRYEEQRYNGCKWLHVGSEIVDDVAVVVEGAEGLES